MKMKGCKAFIEAYKSARVNCATCRHWNGHCCIDIDKAIKVSQEYDREMKSNKPVYME